MEAVAPISSETLEKVLNAHKIGVRKIETVVGPTITLYKVFPALGTRMSLVRTIEDDFTLSVLSPSVRAYFPDESIGIEVANTSREEVSLRAMMGNAEFLSAAERTTLPILLGMDVNRSVKVADLATCPHLLIAGASGQGTDMALHSVVQSLLHTKNCQDVKMIMIDLGCNCLTRYCSMERSRFAVLPGREGADESNVITESTGAELVLQSLIAEMERRYDALVESKCPNISRYRSSGHDMPYIVLVFNEYSGFILGSSSWARNNLAAIIRLASKGRIVGIHLVLATERTGRDIQPGLMKANFPSRLVLKVSTGEDSRCVIDRAGAEKLTGKGDAIFQSGEEYIRVQIGSSPATEI